MPTSRHKHRVVSLIYDSDLKNYAHNHRSCHELRTCWTCRGSPPGEYVPVELSSGPCSPDKRATPHNYLADMGVCIDFVLPEQQGYDGEQHQRCAPTGSWHHDLRLIDCEEH
jgi:hypothetical protein